MWNTSPSGSSLSPSSQASGPKCLVRNCIERSFMLIIWRWTIWCRNMLTLKPEVTDDSPIRKANRSNIANVESAKDKFCLWITGYSCSLKVATWSNSVIVNYCSFNLTVLDFQIFQLAFSHCKLFNVSFIYWGYRKYATHARVIPYTCDWEH